jgi:hypothetical protein
MNKETFQRRLMVDNRTFLPTIAVSLYVVLFAFALWSALPSSVVGSSGVTLSITEHQLASCDADAGARDAGAASQGQVSDQVGRLARASSHHGTAAADQDVYSCALLMGASYN